MFGIQHFSLFMGSALLLNLTPGADMLYVLASTGQRGAAGGLGAAAGISSGCLIHALVAAVGLAALLANAPLTFAMVRFAGAIYLILFGIRLALQRTPTHAPSASARARRSLGHIYRQGLLINVLNPKVMLFFLAFLPQFIVANRTAFLPFWLLGCAFVLSSALVNGLVALLAAPLHRVGRGRAQGLRWLRRGLGCGFVALGVELALNGTA